MKTLLIILALLFLVSVESFSQHPIPYTVEDQFGEYVTKANNYFKNNNYSSAAYWYTQSIECAKMLLGMSHPDNMLLLELVEHCYKALEDYSNAIRIREQILSIQKEAMSDIQLRKPKKLLKEYVHSMSELADIRYKNGDYIIVIDICEEIIDIKKEKLNLNYHEYVSILDVLAICYHKIGNYKKAIELEEQKISILKTSSRKNDIVYARSLNNLAVYLKSNRDIIKAYRVLKESLQIQKEISRDITPLYLVTFNNLAGIYSDIGLKFRYRSHQTSKHFTNLTSASQEETIDQFLEMRLFCTLESLQMIEQIRGDISQLSDEYNSENLVNILNNIATISFRLGLFDEAAELAERAFSIAQETLNKNSIIYIDVVINLSLNYYYSQQYDKVMLLWYNLCTFIKHNALSQFQDMTSAQRQMYWNTNILSNIVISNNLYTKVLSNDKQSMGLSYNSLLFSKGVILASDIEFDKVIRESGDSVLLEKFEELRTTRAILNTYYNKPITERPEGEVERLEARAEVLEKDLLAGSKEYADFTRRLEIEWQDVQAALGDKDVAIEILAADEHIDEDTPPYYAALVLRKGWDAPKFVELCGAEELQAYFDSENGLAMMYREANSRKLYDLIWGKLAEHINEGDNVYFSPGGLLHQVNVELLQDTDGRLANEKYNLHRVSSTRELCFEKPKIAHSEAVLYGGLRYDLDSTTMIAQSRAVRSEEEHYALRGLQLDSLRGKLNYLSASKTEVEKISKQMNQHGIKTTLYVEQIGNEESFKALSGKKTPIIHLATHGFFFKNEEAKVKPFFRMMSMDQERPRPDNSLRRSGLAFAGAQKAWDGEEIPKGIDDGVMLAQEIASMDLTGTDLVVLSACETGLGEINSEGVFGLQRAFKKAGVQTLIMSLWKVHDEATALFMRTFYDNLLSGKSKRDSFAAAQMALREHRDYGKDPYYWASFIMLD